MDDPKEMHEATKGEHINTYEPDIDDIKHLIQLEIQFDKGWISDVKEERIRAIERKESKATADSGLASTYAPTEVLEEE